MHGQNHLKNKELQRYKDIASHCFQISIQAYFVYNWLEYDCHLLPSTLNKY